MKLGLRAKIVIVFTALGLLFAASSYMAYRNNLLMAEAAEAISSTYEVEKYVNEFDDDVDDALTVVNLHIAAGSPPPLAATVKGGTSIVRRLAKLGRISGALTQKWQAEGIWKIANQVPAVTADTVQLANSAGRPGDVIRYRRDLSKLEEQIDFLEHTSKAFAASIGTKIENSQRAQTQMLGFLALLGFSSLGMVWFFSSRVVQPLSELGSQLRSAAAGRLDARVNIATGDEIERAGNAFNKLVTRLGEEETLAATLQEKLLPNRIPVVPGLTINATQRQARLVGGDWYDYHVMDGTLAFTIADSSGKGMAGALLSSVAMTALRSQTRTRANICKVLEHVNVAIENRLGGDKFVTLITGFVDPRTGIVTFVNCGHEQPLVFDSSRKAWRLLDAPATLPLGISFEHFRPRPVEIPLQPGSKILLYTDGLHDVRDERRRFLDMSEIISWLEELGDPPVDSLVGSLLKQALDYAGGDIRDDITIVGLEFSPVPAAVPERPTVM